MKISIKRFRLSTKRFDADAISNFAFQKAFKSNHVPGYLELCKVGNATWQTWYWWFDERIEAFLDIIPMERQEIFKYEN